MSLEPPDEACLDEATIRGWVEKSLGGARRALAQRHIESCEECFALVAEVHAGSAMPHPQPEGRRYALGVELGRGGMGVVYGGRDRLLDRDVAIKVLKGIGDEPAHRERLLAESTAMARLRHENVVAVHDVVVEAGEAFVVMELVEGQTLRLWFESRHPSTSAVVSMFEQIGCGLVAAHEAGVVHRDFKPENVLVGERGRPQITDFGIAIIGDGPRDVRASVDAGTPAYMAPEQSTDADVDARADQYAFCVSMWEMVFGARPHDGAPAGRGRHARLRRVLERGLRASPEDRFDTMSDLLDAIRRARRPRLVWIGAAGAAGMVVAALAVSSSPPSTTPEQACLEAASALPDEPDPDRLRAIAAHLVSRDAVRGDLLARQARDRIAQITSESSEAARDVCSLEDAREQQLARGCLSSVGAELSIIVDGAAHGDLDLLRQLDRPSSSALCVPWARERAKGEPRGLWARWAVATLRRPLANATVLGRQHRPEGVQLAVDVARRARALASVEVETSAYVAGAWAVADADPDRARHNLERALDLASKGPDRFLEAQVWSLYGIEAHPSWGADALTKSLAGVRRVRSQLSQESLREALAPNITLLALLVALDEGRLDDAIAETRAALELARTHPDQMASLSELDVALLLLEGDMPGLLERLRALRDWSRFNGFRTSVQLANLHADVAATEFDLGLFEDAQRSIAEATALVDGVGASLQERAEVDFAAAAGAARRGDFDTAYQRLAPHRALLRDEASGPGATATRLALGSVMLVEGRHARAIELLERAQDVSDDAALESFLPLVVALRRDGRASDARARLTPLASSAERDFPKLPTTSFAKLVMGWLDMDAGDHASARARFEDVLDEALTPSERDWAEFGSIAASTALRGGTSTDAERSRVLALRRRFSTHARAHTFELDAIDQWLDSR